MKSASDGTQSVRRALEVVKLLKQHHASGLRLMDVSELAGLSKSTAHRLLDCLVEAQFAERDADSKRYRLGVEALHAGFTAAVRFPVVDNVRLVMRRLARISGGTVCLCLRHEDEVVYLHHEGQRFEHRAPFPAGNRRLLGLSMAGTALLSRLGDGEIDAHLARNEVSYHTTRTGRDSIWQAVETARTSGYAVIAGSIEQQVSGVAAIIPQVAPAEAALSIATGTDRFNPALCTNLGHMLVTALNEASTGR